MDIETLRKHKKILEEEIRSAISRFEKVTGTNVENINMNFVGVYTAIEFPHNQKVVGQIRIFLDI